MPLAVFSLIILAAFLHALWNLLVKKTAQNFSIFYLGLIVGVLVYSPLLFIAPPTIENLKIVLPYIIASGIIHAIYYIALIKTYRDKDISFAYPFARGGSIILTTLGAYFILGETVSKLGVLGILIIILGISTTTLRHLKRFTLYDLQYPVLVSLLVAGFSLVDSQGVKIIDPISYILLMVITSIILVSPRLLSRQYRRELASSWQNYGNQSLIIGLGYIGTYLIVLFAFRLAPVSYVVAVREIAIVIGAVLGFKYLNERYTSLKIVGILIILLGLILIKLA